MGVTDRGSRDALCLGLPIGTSICHSVSRCILFADAAVGLAAILWFSSLCGTGKTRETNRKSTFVRSKPISMRAKSLELN